MQWTLLNWQVQKCPFLLGFLCRKRVLVCSRSGLFNFPLLFAPANCSEIVLKIRDFRGDCLNIWLFIKKWCTSKRTFFIILIGFLFGLKSIYKTPFSFSTELFNLFKPSFLLIPNKIHLKVAPFALNIAIFSNPYAIFHKLWHPLQTRGSNLNPIFLKNQ